MCDFVFTARGTYTICILSAFPNELVIIINTWLSMHIKSSEESEVKSRMNNLPKVAEARVRF